jgi:hypothetical protein
MRWRTTAGFALVAALSAGCGTVQNFSRAQGGGERPLEIYGGTKRSYETLEGMCCGDFVLFMHGARQLPRSPLYAPDVALSVVGDTLTLPVTVPVSILRAIDKAITEGINNYYFPKDRVPQVQPETFDRRIMPTEPSRHTPERIEGGIL